MRELECNRELLTMALISGADVSMLAFELQQHTFNIHRDINQPKQKEIKLKLLNETFVSNCRQFPDISQSSVATRLRYGGIFNDCFITRLLLSLSVKGFCKSVNICPSYEQEQGVVSCFLTHKQNKLEMTLSGRMFSTCVSVQNQLTSRVN